MDFEALRDLIVTHPDWPSVDDATLTTWCNETAVQRIADRVNSGTIYELVDSAEWNALSVESQNEVWNTLLLFGQEGVPTAAGSRARSRLVAIFGAGSNTINNVVAAITYYISRVAASDVGADEVREGDVQYARTLA